MRHICWKEHCCTFNLFLEMSHCWSFSKPANRFSPLLFSENETFLKFFQNSKSIQIHAKFLSKRKMFAQKRKQKGSFTLFLKLFETCKSIDLQSKFVSKKDTTGEKNIAVHLLFSWKWAIFQVFPKLQNDSDSCKVFVKKKDVFTFLLKNNHFSTFSKPSKDKTTQF